MDRVIDAVVAEDIALVIKKDGVFQVYTDCPNQYKGDPCIDFVKRLDGHHQRDVAGITRVRRNRGT